MGGRYLIICKPIDGAPPWVVAETPDHDWAKDEAILWRVNVALSLDEAQLDPDFAAAAAAWDRGDDSTYAAAMAMDDAETVVWDAVEAIGGTFKNKGDFLDTKHGADLEVLEAFHEIQARYVGESVRFYRDGKPEAGAQLARLIARDTGAWKGGSVWEGWVSLNESPR